MDRNKPVSTDWKSMDNDKLSTHNKTGPLGQDMRRDGLQRVTTTRKMKNVRYIADIC